MIQWKSLTCLIAALLLCSGCQTSPRTPEARADLNDESMTSLNMLRREYPALDSTLNNAFGYAIFPSIGKGGAIVGGAWGRGQVYRNGQMIGYVDMNQGSVGAQLGGETY